MKTLAIVSAINSNYGTLLQAYATQQVFEGLGFETNILYYTSNPLKDFYRIFNIPFLKTKLKAVNVRLITRIRYPLIYKNVQIREKAFMNFRKTALKITPKFESKSQLSDFVSRCDGVILGSDQVWNPQNLEMDYYTLNFVPENIPKIAYAPSFGVDEIPGRQIRRTEKYLKRINFISVREIAGAGIVKKLIGKSVPVVCDPTALLTANQWEQMMSAKKYIRDKYVFCYFLGANETYRKFAEKVSALKGYKIVALQHLDEFVKSDLNFGDIVPYDVDPSDFVSLIANAEMVLTDSFHGTMFSLYFHKDFFTFNYDIQGSKNSVNSRIDSIMDIMDIKDRRLSGTEAVEDCMERQIDWENIDFRLNNFRKESMDYIQNALKGTALL